jgi:hypothetical protein
MDQPVAISIDSTPGPQAVVTIQGNTIQNTNSVATDEGIIVAGINSTVTIGGVGSLANTFENFASQRSIHLARVSGALPTVTNDPSQNTFVNSPNPIQRE